MAETGMLILLISGQQQDRRRPASAQHAVATSSRKLRQADGQATPSWGATFSRRMAARVPYTSTAASSASAQAALSRPAGLPARSSATMDRIAPDSITIACQGTTLWV